MYITAGLKVALQINSYSLIGKNWCNKIVTDFDLKPATPSQETICLLLFIWSGS